MDYHQLCCIIYPSVCLVFDTFSDYCEHAKYSCVFTSATTVCLYTDFSLGTKFIWGEICKSSLYICLILTNMYICTAKPIKEPQVKAEMGGDN